MFSDILNQSRLSASSWTLANCVEWLMWCRGGLPFRGTLLVWRNGQTGTWWKSSYANTKPCSWEGITPCTSTSWGQTAANRFWRKSLEIFVVYKLSISECCVKGGSTYTVLARVLSAVSRKWYFLSIRHLWYHIWILRPVWVSPVKVDASPTKTIMLVSGLEHRIYKENLRELGLFSTMSWWLILLLSTATYQESIKEMEVQRRDENKWDRTWEILIHYKKDIFLAGRWLKTRAACLEGLCQFCP